MKPTVTAIEISQNFDIDNIIYELGNKNNVQKQNITITIVGFVFTSVIFLQGYHIEITRPR